jgi:hypothetical protein
MRPPRVSVLLPARDAERTVRRAVESVLAGTLADLEVLAVDDGSRDGTREVLEALARADPRVRVLAGHGEGLVAALGTALAAARAPYLARMDADDEALPRRLEASVEALEADPSLAGVGTSVEVFRDDQPVSPSMSAYVRWLNGLTTPERLARERFVESPLCHPSVCLRRAPLLAVGAWEAGPFPEDYQLWLKLLDAGQRLRNLPEVLLRWRDSGARLTRTDPRYGWERFLFLKGHFLARLGALRARPCTMWGTGPTGLKLTRLLRERGVEVARFVDLHPRKVGTRIHGIPVLHPRELGGPGEGHLVAAVGAHGARDEIRAELGARGWAEGVDFTCAA